MKFSTISALVAIIISVVHAADSSAVNDRQLISYVKPSESDAPEEFEQGSNDTSKKITKNITQIFDVFKNINHEIIDNSPIDPILETDSTSKIPDDTK